MGVRFEGVTTAVAGLIVLALTATAAACGGDASSPGPSEPASTKDNPPTSTTPMTPTPSVGTQPDPHPAPDVPPCETSPCAARPIVFVHGQGGGNNDAAIFDAMIHTTTGSRWDAHIEAGTKDHQSWAPRSIPRRSWLFAFDYYVSSGKDKRGSYTAGPGRIGSDASFACASPMGKGHLVPNDPSYDDTITHDYASDLAAFIDDVIRATGVPSSKVDVVAHSMGGLVLRSYLTFFGGNAKVEHVLLLASPHLGVPFATAGSIVIGEPWMTAHELTELDRGSFFAKAKFSRCGVAAPAGEKTVVDSWPNQLLAAEKVVQATSASTPMPDLHCMSGSKDILVSYDSAHHPQCVDHIEVEGVDHSGLLHAKETSDRALYLLGGLVTSATPF